MHTCFNILTFFFLFNATVAFSSVNTTAVASGDWSSQTVWSCNCIPASNANVVIPENVTVTITESILLIGPVEITVTVNGTLNLGEGSLYLDSNDAITLGEHGRIASHGRSGAGLYFGKVPVLISALLPLQGSNTITAGKLPPRMIGFMAEQDGKEVQIRWSSIHWFDYDVFILERSSDGVQFAAIDEQKTKDITNYVYYDAQPLDGLTYYRLTAKRKKQNDESVVIVTSREMIRKVTY